MMVTSVSQSSSTVPSVSSTFPAGYRFQPTDEELVCNYLARKVRGLPLPLTNVVVDMDVYAKEPWLLPNHNIGTDHEQYYFVKRQNKSSSGNGKTPNRDIREGKFQGGWWKASTGDKNIQDDKQGRIVGYKKMLNFLRYKDNRRIRKECVKTEWIMHEYRLPSAIFQEWVVCRIKNKGLRKKKVDMQIINEESIQNNVLQQDMGFGFTSQPPQPLQQLHHNVLQQDMGFSQQQQPLQQLHHNAFQQDMGFGFTSQQQQPLQQLHHNVLQQDMRFTSQQPQPLQHLHHNVLHQDMRFGFTFQQQQLPLQQFHQHNNSSDLAREEKKSWDPDNIQEYFQGSSLVKLCNKQELQEGIFIEGKTNEQHVLMTIQDEGSRALDLDFSWVEGLLSDELLFQDMQGFQRLSQIEM